jgi:hypothetical protein
MLDADEELRPGPTDTRVLATSECGQVAALIEEGFWRVPLTDAGERVMDGETWSITGFRCGEYREVSRHTGNVVSGTGATTFALGAWLVRAAGLRRHGYDDATELEA